MSIKQSRESSLILRGEMSMSVKKITLLLLGVFIFVSCSVVAPARSAEAADIVDDAINIANGETAGESADVKNEEATGTKLKVKDLNGYQEWYDMLQTAKGIIAENKTVRAEIKELKKALSKEQKEALKESITPKREQLKALRTERKALAATQKANWAALKTAKKADDAVAMQAAFDQIVQVRAEKNDVLTQINSCLDEILAIVQNPPVSEIVE